MKLVYIIAGLDAGGAESFLVKLSRELLHHHAIEVISLSSEGQLTSQLRDMGVTVTRLGMRPGRFNISKFLRLVAMLKQSRPDLVHAWMYHAAIIGGVAARLAAVPRLVWSIHHSNLSRRANKTTTLAVVRLAAVLSHIFPCRIVYVAHAARAVHERVGFSRSKGAVIHNGFDVLKFRPDPAARAGVRAELGVSDAVPLVGVIARFDVQKGHAIFVDAAARLRTLVPDARFVLAGRDVDSQNRVLMHWIEKAEIADKVFLLGHRKDVDRLMASLDVLLLPSVGEAFPNVVGEAMASGVPCVATDVGDAAMLISDTGLVSPPRDAACLSEQIAGLLRLPRAGRQALGVRARQRIEQDFQLAAAARKYDALYANVWKTIP
jgi:glycosyltransferase involved in cell wall biosynthesis